MCRPCLPARGQRDACVGLESEPLSQSRVLCPVPSGCCLAIKLSYSLSPSGMQSAFISAPGPAALAEPGLAPLPSAGAVWAAEGLCRERAPLWGRRSKMPFHTATPLSPLQPPGLGGSCRAAVLPCGGAAPSPAGHRAAGLQLRCFLLSRDAASALSQVWQRASWDF